MPRNLILCCDGTNNEFGPENTNVVRLVQSLNRDPIKQWLYYDPGVGTLPEPGAFSKVQKWVSKVFGLAFGAGLSWKVGEAYTYLMETWEPGDSVFLFGFSRGAYTVRVLAGMLYALGLLPRHNPNLVPYVIRLFGSLRWYRPDPNVGVLEALQRVPLDVRPPSDGNRRRAALPGPLPRGLGYRVVGRLGMGPEVVPLHRIEPGGRGRPPRRLRRRTAVLLPAEHCEAGRRAGLPRAMVPGRARRRRWGLPDGRWQPLAAAVRVDARRSDLSGLARRRPSPQAGPPRQQRHRPLERHEARIPDVEVVAGGVFPEDGLAAGTREAPRTGAGAPPEDRDAHRASPVDPPADQGRKDYAPPNLSAVFRQQVMDLVNVPDTLTYTP